MLNAIQVARYFLAKDPTRSLFNKELIVKNGRTFYQGNARLNKYIHLVQNLHIAKTGERLFEDDLYAYDNGAVAPSVRENYSILLSQSTIPELPKDISDFLDKFYVAFQGASLDELIELSHEDQEWIEKHGFFEKSSQKMDSLCYADEYKKQYADMLKVMDMMEI